LHEDRERDAVFVTEDAVHVVEATVSRAKQKAIDDCKKTARLIESLRKRHPDKDIRGWLVTRDTPTAEQVEAVRMLGGSRVRIVSFDRFCKKLVDVFSYLQARTDHYFGSARNLADLDDFEAVGPYVPVAFERIDREDDVTGRSRVDDVITALRAGEKIVSTGDYGSGKSMALREIFFRLKAQREAGGLDRFPVYVNLRDHWGQSNPSEVLERHARRMGFPYPYQSVRAWKAGLAILLLDGFDELAAEGWSGRQDRVREIRRKATAVVAALVKETPKESGIVVAGRSQYFDSTEEMISALGFPKSVTHLNVGDFTEEEVRLYLEKLGQVVTVPDWLPSRPLLLGHLATRNLLRGLSEEAKQARGRGWHALVNMICEREAALPQAEIEAHELRDVLARIATKARGTEDGLGPLRPEDLFRAYQQIMRTEPGDAARPLLLRLPDLAGASAAEAGSRKFVDGDFVQAAAAFDIVRFLQSHDLRQPELKEVEAPIEPLGAEVASIEAREREIEAKQVSEAVRLAAQDPDAHVLALDCLRVAEQLDVLDRCPDVVLDGIETPEIDLAEDWPILARAEFQDCVVHDLRVPERPPRPPTPRFRKKCIFGLVIGRTGQKDLPEGWFDDSCAFEKFTSIDPNTASIMRSNLPVPVKVLLTVLKKLFRQRGAGRREGAFYRGLDSQAQRFVAAVLEIVKSEDLAEPTLQNRTKVWVPLRSAQQRVLEILEAPSRSRDPAIEKARRLC
ncbi:MAG: NACHT domain-containing protein, partial [Geminicoccaceae bacterium]|nr:NACHT domain-containing protein [Geminicoccaceae bacterium]